MLGCLVGHIKIVGLCREFAGQGVYLLYKRNDAKRLALVAYCKKIGLNTVLGSKTGYLEVRETVNLGTA